MVNPPEAQTPAPPTEPSERRRLILTIGLPIIGSMVSQNVLNLVDTAMVGQLPDSDNALAAVGTGGVAFFLAVALIMGLSSGVQAMVSRRKGEGREDVMAIPLNGALAGALLLGLPLSVALWFLAPTFYPLLNDDPEVIQYAVPYMQIRILAVIAVGMNFSFRGFWNGTNRSKLYMQTIIVMHICNIVLNWSLIYGNLGMPALGTDGAAIGTMVSTYIGTFYYLVLARRHASDQGFLKGLPDREGLSALIRVSLPSGISTLAMALGYNVLYAIIGMVGTQEVAAAAVLVNIMFIAMLPAMGMGLASASLVGQALGRGDVPDARKWAWDVVRISLVMLVILGLPMWLLPGPILSVFLDNPETVELARWPLILIGLTTWVHGFAMVFFNSIVGAGASRRAMAISIALQWGFFLPAAYVVGPVLGYGLLGIWITELTWRFLQAAVYTQQWQSDCWTDINV